jgi:hypothetical protein
LVQSVLEETMAEGGGGAVKASLKRLPQFYCAGTNGRALVSEILLELGWEQRTRAEVAEAKQKNSWQK